ncbi:hypothetical protein GH5_00211 [Leishmania sp. Ghana 2012 LV757]|uniref:hypothetical protein n=1 Tax=Leishmania sp. Ghana 2012 LV757 TaxID=2803181 RepID=UPI001B49F374|nr:hypothetical protein GH5_00211 [Leishmania sp. Ghana 2012 LV757]
MSRPRHSSTCALSAAGGHHAGLLLRILPKQCTQLLIIQGMSKLLGAFAELCRFFFRCLYERLAARSRGRKIFLVRLCTP